MSVSASASLHVGFEILEGDFWETRKHTDDHLSCPKGHTEGASKGKHCSECGGKFKHQKSESQEPTEGFKKLCDEQDIHPTSVLPPEDWPEADPAYLDGLDVFVADGYDDADTEVDSWALGLTLIYTGDILHMEGAGEPLPVEKIHEAIAKVAAVRDQLGLGDRPVNLYLASSCSY